MHADRQRQGPTQPPVDRQKASPSLISVYFSTNAAPTSSDDLRERYASPPDAHLHVWPDTSLRELCEALEVIGDASSAGAYNVALIYPDVRGALKLRQIGAVSRRKRSPSDAATLASSGWQPGDSMEVCLTGSANMAEAHS